MNGWDWNEIQMNMLCIRWGIQEFVWVMSFAFTLQIAADIAIRGRELRIKRLGQIRRHWKFAIATVVVLLLSWIFLPNVKAETIIERRDAQGKVTSTEVQRTAREQEQYDHAYVNPKDGSMMFFVDGATNVDGFDPQRERNLQIEPGFGYDAPAADQNR